MCSMNGKKNGGAGCGETGMECYKMRLERQAMIGTLEFILSAMGAYPKIQTCDRLRGSQSTRWSWEHCGEMELGKWKGGKEKPRHDFSIRVAPYASPVPTRWSPFPG